MIRDYSSRLQRSSDRGRRTDKDNKARVGVIHKTISALMLLIMGCGLLFTLWMGQEIRNCLHELSNGKKSQEELSAIQETLRLKRNDLMTRENIEIAALRQGLRRPAANQILRP